MEKQIADMLTQLTGGTDVMFESRQDHPLYPYVMVNGTVRVAETVLAFRVPIARSRMGDSGNDSQGTNEKTRSRAARRRDK